MSSFVPSYPVGSPPHPTVTSTSAASSHANTHEETGLDVVTPASHKHTQTHPHHTHTPSPNRPPLQPPSDDRDVHLQIDGLVPSSPSACDAPYHHHSTPPNDASCSLLMQDHVEGIQKAGPSSSVVTAISVYPTITALPSKQTLYGNATDAVRTSDAASGSAKPETATTTAAAAGAPSAQKKKGLRRCPTVTTTTSSPSLLTYSSNYNSNVHLNVNGSTHSILGAGPAGAPGGVYPPLASSAALPSSSYRFPSLSFSQPQRPPIDQRTYANTLFSATRGMIRIVDFRRTTVFCWILVLPMAFLLDSFAIVLGCVCLLAYALFTVVSVPCGYARSVWRHGVQQAKLCNAEEHCLCTWNCHACGCPCGEMHSDTEPGTLEHV